MIFYLAEYLFMSKSTLQYRVVGRGVDRSSGRQTARCMCVVRGEYKFVSVPTPVAIWITPGASIAFRQPTVGNALTVRYNRQ